MAELGGSPEGELIELARQARVPRLTANRAAELAGMSSARWRQIVSGRAPQGGGRFMRVRGPADTIARMASVVGVTSVQLRMAGREDAAEVMEHASFAERPAATNRPRIGSLSEAADVLNEIADMLRRQSDNPGIHPVAGRIAARAEDDDPLGEPN